MTTKMGSEPPDGPRPSPPPLPPPKRLGKRVGTPTHHELNRRKSESERAPSVKVPKPRIDINLNRKLMTHGIIQQLRDTAKGKDMLAGSAVIELLDEYDRMRYLMEGLITAYERNNEKDVRKILEVLQILL